MAASIVGDSTGPLRWYLLTLDRHQKGASLEVVTHFQESGDLSSD